MGVVELHAVACKGVDVGCCNGEAIAAQVAAQIVANEVDDVEGLSHDGVKWVGLSLTGILSVSPIKNRQHPKGCWRPGGNVWGRRVTSLQWIAAFFLRAWEA